MQADGDRPALGASWKTLGVRPGVGPRTDIPVDDEGLVAPGTGGMSVTPDDPMRMLERTPWLLPKSLGGKGRYPLWSIAEREIGPGLVYRSDPDDPYRHGFIEPARRVPFVEYQELIEGTRDLWTRMV
jgi:hypothetical protein